MQLLRLFNGKVGGSMSEEWNFMNGLPPETGVTPARLQTRARTAGTLPPAHLHVAGSPRPARPTAGGGLHEATLMLSCPVSRL